MSKAQQTRENIIKQAAELFNQKGYAGSSIADIMSATGLKKGGIYNHFQNKEEIAIAAFDYACSCYSKRNWNAVRTTTNAIERLKALISLNLDYLDNAPLAGGCMILNTAVESDDTHPVLRDRVRSAMNDWRSLICRIIEKGIKKGEVNATVEPDETATIIISTVEGAIMMSKLYSDSIHLKRAVKHLNNYIDKNL
jgi:AcrR family transcriptional regulator